MRTTTIAVVSLAALMFAAAPAGTQPHDDKERAELAKAMKDAKISLAQGVKAGARAGTPISGKYEIEDGKLQLSVYTVRREKFSEVIVDHKTGKVAKTEPITKDDDLKDARAQRQVMAKAKRSLAAAATEAMKANAGFRAVAVVPAVKDDHPMAEVTLLKGAEWKTVTEKLD